ncbi:MAG: bifunctional aspartate kinase/diaminopimelate decarboxylase [Myxococcota bacterium]|nr:bifunctional aspartate kinase/diaminopimelate decarboxylase [Myxococcota bacterium]
MSRALVVKFGGSSVSRLSHLKTIAMVLQQRAEMFDSVVAVCSAFSGVSDQLSLLCDALDSQSTDQGHLAQIILDHQNKCEEFGVPFDPNQKYIADLRTLTKGAALIGEVSPTLRARIMSAGELLSTTIIHQFLMQCNLSCAWWDARKCLQSTPTSNPITSRLSAVCTFDSEPSLMAKLKELETTVVITQGFIAAQPDGSTVILGRGGSDTSAAYFAAKLQAVRLEIWSDVPGLFTANPKLVDNAKLLRVLNYDEAQEMATTGAKALHPRCILPLKHHRIPLHLCATPFPNIEGTKITDGAAIAGVKSISSKKGVYLVSMDTLGMWQQAGFLADVFACFKRFDLSIDLVATSETNVTVSLHFEDNGSTPSVWSKLKSELEAHCQASLVGPCAAISLVGSGMRASLHKLGGIFEYFAEHRLYLMSQAASDLNLTVVVDEAISDALVKKLHSKLIGGFGDLSTFGTPWNALSQTEDQPVKKWWHSQIKTLTEIGKSNPTPHYIYHLPTIQDRLIDLKSLSAISQCFYAIKANSNPRILELVHQSGFGFECVSIGEVQHVRRHIGDKATVLFTPNFASRSELKAGRAECDYLCIDALHPLEHWASDLAGTSIFLRIDLGWGGGHHKHVVTGGKRSKFGIGVADLPKAIERCQQANITIVGLHNHSGSGITDSEIWATKTKALIELAADIPTLRYLDIGGGFGLDIDLSAVDSALLPISKANPNIELWIEPGRFVVADSGIILSTVTQIKSKLGKCFVGSDAGMHTLIRPALYGAWHDVHNLSKGLNVPPNHQQVVDIAGPICESGDIMARNRRLPTCEEGDILLIDTTGAYGWCMSSEYNQRPKPPETLLT